MRVIGVDACKAGWVAVSLTDGSYTGLRVETSLAAVLTDSAHEANPDAVGIDMPLGLLESGWRTADRQAQRLLGPRRSSVFAIPPRAVWAQDSYAAANLLCRDLTGLGFSVQAWGLRRKLLEANEYRDTGEASTDSTDRLYEVHPELAFGALAGQPLSDSKHTPAGSERRRELLASAGIVIPKTLKPLTDILDAAAVAWSAQRIATGSAEMIPDPPQYDTAGREISIRY
jgi:predicted RNase H-like nuclease